MKCDCSPDPEIGECPAHEAERTAREDGVNLYQSCPSCSTGSHVTYLLGDEARESCSNPECVLYPKPVEGFFDAKREKARFAADTRDDSFAAAGFYERGEVDPW